MDSRVSLEHELLTEPNQHQLDTVPQRALVTKLYFAGFLKTEGDDFERDHTFQKVDPLKVKEKDNKSSVFRPQKMPKKKKMGRGQRHIISKAQASPKRNFASQPGNEQNFHSKSDVKADLLRLVSVTS